MPPLLLIGGADLTNEPPAAKVGCGFVVVGEGLIWEPSAGLVGGEVVGVAPTLKAAGMETVPLMPEPLFEVGFGETGEGVMVALGLREVCGCEGRAKGKFLGGSREESKPPKRECKESS